MTEENFTPFVLTILHITGSTDVSAFKTYERATWNFSDSVIKPFVRSARITTGGGNIVLASWVRQASELVESSDSEIVSLINALRKDEGHSVSLHNDNADFNGLPDCVIEVCGDYTDWNAKQFRAGTVIAALRLAVDEMRRHDAEARP